MHPKVLVRPLKQANTPLGEYELKLRLYIIDKDKHDKQERELLRLFKEIMHSVDSRYYMHFKKVSTPY